MKNKKILAGLAATLTLVGCASTSTNTESGSSTTKEDTVHVSVYKGEYINLLGEDNINTIYGMGLTLDDGEVAMLGADLTQFTFTDYDGNEVSLPSEGPYVVEILGSWCQYCQRLTKETLQDALDNGIKVYQYFLSAENEDIDSFYSEVGFDAPDGVVRLRNCSDFEDWIYDKGITSVPQALVVDESGKVAMSHIGYVDTETFMSFYEYALTAKLYETKIDGQDLQTYLNQQVKIKNYIENLEEIDIPKSALED